MEGTRYLWYHLFFLHIFVDHIYIYGSYPSLLYHTSLNCTLHYWNLEIKVLASRDICQLCWNCSHPCPMLGIHLYYACGMWIGMRSGHECWLWIHFWVLLELYLAFSVGLTEHDLCTGITNDSKEPNKAGGRWPPSPPQTSVLLGCLRQRRSRHRLRLNAPMLESGNRITRTRTARPLAPSRNVMCLLFGTALQLGLIVLLACHGKCTLGLSHIPC